jgi:hypothetical protein
MVTGLALDRVGAFPERQLLEALQAEIHPARRQCALLPLNVLQAGVNAYLANSRRA